MTNDQLAEMSSRHRMSQLIRCIVMVLQASHAILPAASWYAAKVFWACSRAKKLKVSNFTLLSFTQYFILNYTCYSCLIYLVF